MNGGGFQPLWSPKGNELFYRKGAKVFSVGIDLKLYFSIGKAHDLFHSINFYVSNYSDYNIHP